MAAKKKKSPKVTVDASGSVVGRGEITGKGTITLSLADATKVKLSVEKNPSGTKVVLSNATNLRIWKSHKLQITGSIAEDFNTPGLDEGKVGLSFNLPKGVDVSIQHHFKPGADETSMKISFSF
jgi:hypothetical protein